MNASHRTITRWGARATTSLAAVAIAAAALPGSAQAAEAGTPSVVGGAAAVQSGSTIRISYPANRLAAGETTINRTIHARIVFAERDCAGSSISLGGSGVSRLVPFAERNNTFTLDYEIPSRGNTPLIETYFLCAYEKGQSGPGFVDVASPYVTWPIRAGANAAVTPALPATPTIVSGTTATGVPAGGAIQVSAGLISFGPPDEVATKRSIRKSVVAAPGVDSCAGGSGVSELDVLLFGLRDVTANVVVSGNAGQYLCIDQLLTTTTDPRVRTSPPVVSLITGHTPTGLPAASLLGVNAAIARAQAATQTLIDLNVRGNISAAEAAAALQEAQQAQDALQAAQAAAAAGNDPANAANPNGADAVVPADAGGAAAADALDTLRQQLGATVGDTPVRVSPQSNPTLLALAAATGFDPLATPILTEGASSISGVSLSVAKPKKIKRGKGFKATLKVAPASTRGGMRQYLLRMDGDQPTLIHKRSGFITKGLRSKKYWISPKAPKGTYALLSTFQPSTPGMAGSAILTPLTVK